MNIFHLRLVRFDSTSSGAIICKLLINNFISRVWFNFDMRLIFDSVMGIPNKISSNPLYFEMAKRVEIYMDKVNSGC